MPSERELERRASYKKVHGADEGRRRREVTTLQIRKAKKDERLQQRRRRAPTEEKPLAAANHANSTNNNASSERRVHDISELPRLVQIIQTSQDGAAQLDAVRAIRRMLSVERNAPVKEVVETGVLQKLAQFLYICQFEELQFESAWALTNVASSNYTAAVVNAGAVEPLILCLQSSNPNVREQAAWCIGNIAGESTEMRDMLLQKGALQPLLLNVQDPAYESLLGNVVWTISNLLRGKPLPDLNLISPTLPHLGKLLLNPPSTAILVDVLWALSYVSDGPNERIQAVMALHGIVPKLVQLLESDASAILTPAIRCLGNFVSGDAHQTQIVVDSGILQHMVKLLDNPRKNIQKETCWVLSNIAAGTTDQIAALMSKLEIVRLVALKARKASWDIRKEAIWAVSNVFTTGTHEHVHMLVGVDGINAICDALLVNDPSVTLVALEGLEKVLQVGDEMDGDDYLRIVDECDGIDKIEQLQGHSNDKVYEMAIHIIDTYLGSEEEEVENLAPATNGDTYAFGLSPSKQLFQDSNSSMKVEAELKEQNLNFGLDFGRSHE